MDIGKQVTQMLTLDITSQILNKIYNQYQVVIHSTGVDLFMRFNVERHKQWI